MRPWARVTPIREPVRQTTAEKKTATPKTKTTSTADRWVMCRIAKKKLIRTRAVFCPKRSLAAFCMMPRKMNSSVKPVHTSRIRAGKKTSGRLSTGTRGCGCKIKYSASPRGNPASPTRSWKSRLLLPQPRPISFRW